MVSKTGDIEDIEISISIFTCFRKEKTSNILRMPRKKAFGSTRRSKMKSKSVTATSGSFDSGISLGTDEKFKVLVPIWD